MTAKSNAATPAPDAITLDEFCLITSRTDKRIELLSAFGFVERAAGRVKDSAEAYSSRFAAFANQPA